MKTITKALITLCIIALFAGVSAAETANKDLPSEAELISLTENFKVSENYISELSSCIVKDYPAYKYDIWEVVDGNNTVKVISVYYNDPVSSEGYGSIYYDENGRRINRMCGITYNLLESYMGEPEKATEASKEVVENSIKEEIKENVEKITNNDSEENETEEVTEEDTEEESKEETDYSSMSRGSKIDLIIKLLESLKGDL